MPEPISASAVGAAFVLGAAYGAGEEVGKRAVAYASEELPKVVEEGWKRHDEANAAWGTGLNQQKPAQA